MLVNNLQSPELLLGLLISFSALLIQDDSPALSTPSEDCCSDAVPVTFLQEPFGCFSGSSSLCLQGAVCDPCSHSWGRLLRPPTLLHTAVLGIACPAREGAGSPGPPAQSPSKLQLSFVLSSEMAGGLGQCSFRFAS